MGERLWCFQVNATVSVVKPHSGGEKPHKGRSPTAVLSEPEPPIGGKQLPFVM